MSSRNSASQPIEVAAADLAGLFGVDRRTVTRWLDEGLPSSRGGGALRIGLGAAIRWVRERDRRAAEERLAAQRASLDPEGARAAKLRAEAQLKEMDVLERAGKLTLVEDVESAWTQTLVAFREGVMNVPGNAVQAGIIPAAREPELEELCRDALVAISREMAAPAAAVSGGQE